MKNNVPLIYWTFRMAWTVLHFVVVAAAAAALLIWAVTDDRAARAIEPATESVLTLQQQVANAIPWPWATDENDGGGGSSDSSSYSGNESPSVSDGEYQVIGNVKVRRKPTVKSKQVDTLTDGTWITVDCITDGSRVDPGPYNTDLSEYSGKDLGATTLWVHIPDLGYVSDAYVSTANGAGLPRC